MRNERCQNGEHLWACVTTSQSMGEVRTFRTLSKDEVNLIVKDPNSTKVVCPTGVVACGDCSLSFRSDEPLMTMLPDFEKLNKLTE